MEHENLNYSNNGNSDLAAVRGSAYNIRENDDATFSVVRWTNQYGGYELEMIKSTKAICEEWIAKRS